MSSREDNTAVNALEPPFTFATAYDYNEEESDFEEDLCMLAAKDEFLAHLLDECFATPGVDVLCF